MHVSNAKIRVNLYLRHCNSNHTILRTDRYFKTPLFPVDYM